MPVPYLYDRIKWPEWAGERYRRLDFYQRFLDGVAYTHLRSGFYEEVDSGGTYIPLRERRPSVIYNVPRVIVNRAVRMLFGGAKWPKLVSSDTNVNKFFQRLKDRSELQGAMLEAAFIGSLGSVFIFYKLVNGRFFYEKRNPKFCKPIFDDEQELEEVFIMYPVFGYDLKSQGYDIAQEDMNEEYFYAKRITKQEEIIYHPIKIDEYEDDNSFRKDVNRSFEHLQGFVPGVWVKNLYPTDGVDGECTFGRVLHIAVEIDYQLSQAGRGLKYNADPQLLIKEPPGAPNEQQMSLFGGGAGVRSTSNALFVGHEGDAKLLEMSGQGQKVVIEFVDRLHRYALEAASASHKDPDRAYGNMSGRAMEILDEDLIALCSALRLTWGDAGLKPLLTKMIKTAFQTGLLKGTDPTKDDEFAIELYWGNWFDPTPADLLQSEQALDMAVQGRRLFPHEARMLSAEQWGVGHADAEELEDKWPLPPEPEPSPADKAKIDLQKSKINGAGVGTRGRSDGKVAAR